MTRTPIYPVVGGEGARRLMDSDLRVVVTGAGGWLGLATLEMLHGLLAEAFQDRVVCFGASDRTLALRGGVTIAQQPLAALADLKPAPSLVLHLAFLTQDRAIGMAEADYAGANRAISHQVVSALGPIGAEAVFLASSGAAHVADPAGATLSKGLYGSLKLEDEARFRTWGGASGKTTAIGRVFNLAGPYINKRASYALACFIADALAGRPIEIRASHLVYRSYVAIEELMSVVFAALTGPTGAAVAFDTAGEATLEMGDIATAVAAALGQKLVIGRPPLREDEPADRYVGDGVAYAALRRAAGVVSIPLADQIRQTAAYMASDPGAS